MTWLNLYFASEWIIRIAAIIVLPPRMRPSAARGWLLLLCVLPWPGLILLLTIGRRALPALRTQVREELSVRVRDESANPPSSAMPFHLSLPESLDAVPELARALGDFPVVAANQFTLLPDYAGAHDAMIREIDQAREHVHLLTYIFAPDATGEKFRDALERAVKRGVRCRVLIDKVGSGRSALATTKLLQRAGVEAYLLMPAGLLTWRTARLDLRNHRKIMVVDGRIGFMGSQNIVEAECWKGHPNVELVARVTGPLVEQLQLLFLSDRYAEAGAHVQGESLFPPIREPGASPAQVLPSGPAYKTANNLEVIVTALHGARRRAVLTTPYFIPPEALVDALRTAALRGVDVRLITPHWSNSLPESLAQHSFYEELLEAGARIHRYGPAFLHAKHLSVDDELAVIGSTNLDVRSFALNAEVIALIYDRAVVADLRRVEESYLAHCEEVSLESWRTRPWIQRVGESICRLMDTLL